MNKLNIIRDLICEYCFDVCEHMKNSDEYHVCSLNKKNQLVSECQLWEFLRWAGKKERKGEQDE